MDHKIAELHNWINHLNENQAEMPPVKYLRKLKPVYNRLFTLVRCLNYSNDVDDAIPDIVVYENELTKACEVVLALTIEQYDRF